MKNTIITELPRLLLVVGLFAACGFVFQLPLLLTCIGLALYCMWSIVQLSRAVSWLYRKDSTDPPESIGLWGQVFDGIYNLQQRNRDERRRLQATIDHLRGSFLALSDAVIMVTAGGAIEWCNPAASRLLGLRYPDDRGQQLVNLLRDPQFIAYFDGEVYDDPLQLESPLSHECHLQYQITLFGQRNRIVFARDITKMHNMEQMRKDFIANVSHELRTPLTVISGYLETMMGSEEHFGPMWLKAIGQMQDQSYRMERLLKDLILLARLESVPLSKEADVDVHKLLSTIMKTAQDSAGDQYDWELDCKDHWAIQGNYDEIYSAISNLVFNAVKYSDGGLISISAAEVDSQLHISVRDSGCGIEPQHIPRLTERFYRVDSSRSKETGGTGLGLAIVKHVLMRHGGELNIASKYGKGSCFTCIFPTHERETV